MNYNTNRCTIINSKNDGDVIFSVKNCDTMENIHSEIKSKLIEKGGNVAKFMWWYDDCCFYCNLFLNEL
jgi:hypothetical protein